MFDVVVRPGSNRTLADAAQVVSGAIATYQEAAEVTLELLVCKRRATRFTPFCVIFVILLELVVTSVVFNPNIGPSRRF